jgi:hypothetical protein
MRSKLTFAAALIISAASLGIQSAIAKELHMTPATVMAVVTQS